MGVEFSLTVTCFCMELIVGASPLCILFVGSVAVFVFRSECRPLYAIRAALVLTFFISSVVQLAGMSLEMGVPRHSVARLFWLFSLVWECCCSLSSTRCGASKEVLCSMPSFTKI